MKKPINYSNTIPDKIYKFRIWQKAVSIFLPLIIIITVIIDGYTIMNSMFIILYLFILFRFHIKSFINVKNSCHDVLKENESIINISTAFEEYLLQENDSIRSSLESKHRVMLLYVLMLPILGLHIFFDIKNSAHETNFMIYSLELTGFLTILAFYDLRNIMKYFQLTLDLNSNKILASEISSDLKKSSKTLWNNCLKRWSITAILTGLVVIIFANAVFFLKLASEVYLIIPISFIAVIIFVVKDLRKRLLASLNILKSSDEYIKSKLDLKFVPDLERDQMNVWNKFKHNLRESGYYEIDKDLKKDVRDIFK